MPAVSQRRQGAAGLVAPDDLAARTLHRNLVVQFLGIANNYQW
jgi:hypothetical protein